MGGEKSIQKTKQKTRPNTHTYINYIIYTTKVWIISYWSCVSYIIKDRRTHDEYEAKLTTETKVALDLSDSSFDGESPVARFRFLRGLKKR